MSIASSLTSELSFLDASESPTTIKQNRKSCCAVCRKRLGVMEMSCRCGKKLCVSHLQCEMHDCGLDHKKDGSILLKKQLEIGPLSEKICRI